MPKQKKDWGLYLEMTQSLLRLNRGEIASRFNLQPADFQTGSYGNLTGLTVAYHAETMPARLYLEGDQVILVYVGTLRQFTADWLRAHIATPVYPLRSRAGKHFVHQVFPDSGIAFSTERAGQEIRLFEIFWPQPLADYKRKFYNEPEAFIE